MEPRSPTATPRLGFSVSIPPECQRDGPGSGNKTQWGRVSEGPVYRRGMPTEVSSLWESWNPPLGRLPAGPLAGHPLLSAQPFPSPLINCRHSLCFRSGDPKQDIFGGVLNFQSHFIHSFNFILYMVGCGGQRIVFFLSIMGIPGIKRRSPVLVTSEVFTHWAISPALLLLHLIS